MIAVSMDILKADQLFLLFRPHSSVQRECPSAQKLYIFCTLFHLLETVHFLYTFLQYLSSFLTAPQSSLLIKRKYIIRPYGCSRAVITHLRSWKGSYDSFRFELQLSKRLFTPLSLQKGCVFACVHELRESYSKQTLNDNDNTK